LFRNSVQSHDDCWIEASDELDYERWSRAETQARPTLHLALCAVSWGFPSQLGNSRKGRTSCWKAVVRRDNILAWPTCRCTPTRCVHIGASAGSEAGACVTDGEGCEHWLRCRQDEPPSYRHTERFVGRSNPKCRYYQQACQDL